jgi:lysophospholipase L1-like esterase
VPRERLGRDFGVHVAELCDRLGVRYADVPAALRGARAADPGAVLYRQMDYTHLDPAGHEVAARSLAERLGR